MATPAMTLSQKNLAVLLSSAQILTLQVTSAAGAPVNISSGYTASLYVLPANAPVASTPAVNIITDLTLTPTFGATGLLTIPIPAGALAAGFNTLSNSYIAQVSNDGGTTWSSFSTGMFTINPELNVG